MDKFFIQAAFKSLDEIDLKENQQIKQSLIESRLKEKRKRDLNKREHLNVCAGDPEVNTAAFNHATDINSNFPSTELSEAVTLDEKLPRELAAAYRNTEPSLYAVRLPYGKENKEEVAAKMGKFDIDNADQSTYNTEHDLTYKSSNLSPIDFEKAEYKKITKEEAEKYAKPKDRWHLVLLYHDYDRKLIALRFDKKGKLLNNFDFPMSYRRDNKLWPRNNNGDIIKATQLPIDTLINSADTIYYTNEQEVFNDKYFEDSKEREKDSDLDNIRWYWTRQDKALDTLDIARNEPESELVRRKYCQDKLKYLNIEIDKENRNLNYYEDNIKNLPEDNNFYKSYLEHIEGIKKTLRRLNKLKSVVLRYLNKEIDWTKYNELLEVEGTWKPSYRNSPINYELAKIIKLKEILKKNVDEYKEKSDKYLNGEIYKDDYSYKDIVDHINSLNNQIKELQKKLEDYNNKLSSFDTTEIENKTEKELLAMSEVIKDLNKKLVAKGLKSVFKEAIEKNKFNLKDPDDIEKAKEMKKDSKKENDLVIIHPLLDHKKPQPGNAILTCKDCDDVFYFNKNELKQDKENPTVYNKDIICPNCGGQDGYEYIGDVSLKDSESAENVIKERNDNIESDDFVKDTEKEDKNTKKLEPIDDYEEPEEIVEESFDKLANKYFNKIYENIDLFKTSNISQIDRNKYLIEGVLTDKNKKEKNVSFLLEIVKRNKDHLILKGNLKEILNNKAPFRFYGRIGENKLIFESMRYRYIDNIDSDKYLIEGLEIN